MSSRRQALHEALYVAAEYASDGALNSRLVPDAELAEALRRIANCIYFRNEKTMRRLFKEYGATLKDLERDMEKKP